MTDLEDGTSRAETVESACELGRQWLQDGRPELAITEAERAIAQILQHGLSLPEFIRLALRRAPPELLFRYDRAAVARVRRLHLPLALRWEALRRAGHTADAREMRAVCTRLFPERASVWAEAGNQALDEHDLDRAGVYFARCLQLERDWTAGLAGMAIVHESRKEWNAALPYRQRVVEVQRALERDDGPSLQRVIRYAAALARVERWADAGVLLRRCVGLGAFERVPAERAVLLRVFSTQLFAPALIAAMGAAPNTKDALTPELALALREAGVFATAYVWVRACEALEAGQRLTLLGQCAWLAGDYEHAYALLDEAEVDRAGDLTIQVLLAWSAREIGARESATIERFAWQAVQTALEAPAEVRAGGALARPNTEHLDVAEELRCLVSKRFFLRARGASPLEAALASADDFARLERALA